MNDFAPIECVHDRTVLRGFVARPDGTAPLPAVLMFPGATGPGPSFIRAIVELAATGYVVIGVDMYGGDADVSTREAAGNHFVALMAQPGLLRERTLAWLAAVAALPGVDPLRIAAVGYCFGGQCVLELARAGADLKAAVCFHGLLKTHAPAAPGAVRTPIAIWAGGDDPFAPAADIDAVRAELDAAGADYQVTLFARAKHSFTDPDHDGFADGIAYDPMAHAVAWAGTQAMLRVALAGDL